MDIDRRDFGLCVSRPAHLDLILQRLLCGPVPEQPIRHRMVRPIWIGRVRSFCWLVLDRKPCSTTFTHLQSEAAIMVSYPEPWKRGRYLSMWLAYRNSGSILGGSINLAFSEYLCILTDKYC